MTNLFDQYFNTIMENLDVLTASRLIDQYQTRIRKFYDSNYEADPTHIDRMRQMRMREIEDYEDFIEKNKDEIIKSGLQHKILQFNRELRRIKML